MILEGNVFLNMRGDLPAGTFWKYASDLLPKFWYFLERLSVYILQSGESLCLGYTRHCRIEKTRHNEFYPPEGAHPAENELLV